MKIKIAGVSLWTWAFGATVLASAAWLAIPKLTAAGAWENKPKPLEIVKDGLWTKGGYCEVRGQIHNPRHEPVRDVGISYQLWTGQLGEDDKLIKKKLGTATAEIHYIPPGGTVDYIAHGGMGYDEDDVPGMDKASIKESTDSRR